MTELFSSATALLGSAKIISAVALGVAVFLAVLSALTDDSGPVIRAYRAYVAYLDKKLKSVFLRPSGSRIVAGQVAALLALGGALLLVEIRYWWVGLLLILVGPAWHLDRLRRQRVEQLEAQLDPFIVALANALKTIPNVSAAFQSVAETSPVPIRDEIELCNREMRVGSTLDEALLNMAQRVESQRLDSVLAAVVLGRQIGGNLSRVLESTASSIRESARLEGVLRTKTSEAKMQLYVIGAIPLFLVAALSVMKPNYFEPLTQSATGYAIAIAAVGAWLIALVAARRILAVSM